MKWLLILFLPLTAWAGETLPLEEHGHMLGQGQPVLPPPGARVSLQVPLVVTIGRQIPAALVVSNAGPAPFKIGVGGDYRTTGFPQRMKVKVRDAAGLLLRELPREAHGFGGGGIAFTPEVAPGKSHRIEFPLECYVSFLRPGIHIVTAGHDLGWTVKAGRPHPLGRALVLVRAPSSEEAAAYVRTIFEAQPRQEPADEPARLECQWKLENQLCVLRHPVYLEALSTHAREGSAAAVKGIGHIATPEATEMLLALLDHTSPAVVEEALAQLARRLPAWPGTAREFLWSRPASRFQIDPLTPSWCLRYEQALLKHAARLVAAGELQIVERAALLLQLHGSSHHAPRLLAALQSALSAWRPPESGRVVSSLDMPRPQHALLQALDALRQRGWRARSGGGSADMVAWFRQLADEKVPKPDDPAWRESMLAWITNGPPLARASALQALPQPLSDAAAREVLKALEDPDLHVMRIACQVAGRSARPEFGRPLTQVLELHQDSFLQQAAHEAALACGARMELWEAWASTIPAQERLHEAVRALITGTLAVGGTNGSGNSNFTRDQRFQIRDAWRAFLHEHRRQISQGRKIPPPGGKVARMLTGAAFNDASPVTAVDFPDGSRWPPSATGRAGKR